MFSHTGDKLEWELTAKDLQMKDRLLAKDRQIEELLRILSLFRQEAGSRKKTLAS
jgi:hypothetical protein